MGSSAWETVDLLAACRILSCDMSTLKLRHVGSSSLTRDWTQAPALVVWTFGPWTSRKVPISFFWCHNNYFFILEVINLTATCINLKNSMPNFHIHSLCRFSSSFQEYCLVIHPCNSFLLPLVISLVGHQLYICWWPILVLSSSSFSGFLQVLYAHLHYCNDHNLSLKVSWFSFLLLSLFLLVSCCCSVQFSRWIMSSSLQTHGLQHTRPPCPSPTPEFTQTQVHRVSDAIQPSPSLLGGGFPGGSAGKEFPCNAGDLSSIPRLGRSPGEGKGYLLQYPGLENSMDCIV